MGEFNLELVPAAILYMHPGINREEFAELLNGIKHFGGINNAVLDFDHPAHHGPGSDVFHGGIFELADILGLKNIKTTHIMVDPEERLFEEPDGYEGELFVEPVLEEGLWKYQRYLLQTGTKRKVVGGENYQEQVFAQKPEVGKVFKKFSGKNEYMRLLEICDLEHEVENGYDRFIAIVDYEILKEFPVIEIFDSIEQLAEKHPDYDPDVCIDWSPSEGVLNRPRYRKNYLCWERVGEKYYLREELLEEHDYTSLAITAEAIRKEEWGLFQFHGYCLTQKFLVENASARAVRQRAAYDYWVAQHAKNEKMTNSELLRYRLWGKHREPKQLQLSDREAFHRVYQEACQPHGLLTGPRQPTLEDLFFTYEPKKDTPF